MNREKHTGVMEVSIKINKINNEELEGLIRYCERKGYSLDKTLEFLDAIGTYDRMFVYRTFQDSNDQEETSVVSKNVGVADSDGDENSNKRLETLYCRYCGEEIFKKAVICPHCRRQVAPLRDTNNRPRFINKIDKPKAIPWGPSNINGLLIGTILFPIVGLVAGIYGLIKPGKAGQGFALLMLTILASLIWAVLITGCSSG